MDVKVLRYFVAVVQTGSISQAARVVAVSQPSLSRQIRRLELELGMSLFSRESGRLALTPAGREFAPLASEVVSRFDHAVAVMHELARAGDTLLTVAANITTLEDVIAPFAAEQRQGVVLNLRAESTVALNEVVRRGGADLAISALPSAAGLVGRAVVRFPLFACVSADHPWSTRSRATLRELLDEPLIVLDESSVSRRLFDDAVAELGATYSVVFEAGLSQAAQALAAAGRGIAVLTDEPRFGLRRIPVLTDAGPLTLQLFAVWDPSHYATARIAALVDDMSEYCRRHFVEALAPTG